MIKSRVLSVQLFFLILGNSFASDGCTNKWAWRCGDTCIEGFLDAKCKCGDKIFGVDEQMWCCNNSTCTGKGYEDEDNYWPGEWEGDYKIGAECSGRALNLTEACDQKCNFYEEDEKRNANGFPRGFMPCATNHMNITECVQEDKMRDGKYDCRNRADEEAFQTHIGNSSSLLLDLEKILIPCKDSDGEQGFKCSGAYMDSPLDVSENCLSIYAWCNPTGPFTCKELQGTTATGKTIDHQLCSNQSFWERKTCYLDDYRRCTGAKPGQCGDIYENTWCTDGSSEIEPSGDCGDDLMCRAREGVWMKRKVCIKDQYKCDRVLHCEGKKDEANCNEAAKEWSSKWCGKWCPYCDKAYKAPAGGHCEDKDDLMCRTRDGKFAGINVCLKKKFLE